ALYRNETLGYISVDEKKCSGCRVCAELCPWSGIRIILEGNIARKCDLCAGKPACVEVCRYNALELVAEDSIGEYRKKKAQEKLNQYRILVAPAWPEDNRNA
ncbi:MAG TPA: 4Fe-4S dicluster domain-containing protein, partial [bacterium]|nr:4Fe-4S dicluster domain-containing protein [bacterium]